MIRIRLAALALAVAASSPATALAQRDSKSETPTAAAVSKQQSAASLLEQAAYAEEHERDFKKAAALYAKALQVAQDVGDAALTKKARAASDRLTKVLNGEIAAPSSSTPPSQAVDADDPIVTRIAALMTEVFQSQANSGPLGGAHKDLAMFGDTAVPYILQACRGTAVVGSSTVPMDTAKFCRVLSQMDSPKVAAALTELAQSIDPLTRRTVVQLVHPDRDRKLLLAAVEDPVAEVRDAALGRLMASDSADLMPLMRGAATRGNPGAIAWVACHDSTVFFAVLEDPATPDDTRALALRDVVENDVVRRAIAPTNASVDALLRLGRSKNAKVARLALLALKICAEEPAWRGKPADFFARIEIALGSDLAGFPVPEVWNLELAVGSANALEPLMKSLVPQVRVLDRDGYAQLTNAIQIRLQQQTAAELPRLVAAFGAIPTSTETASDNSGYLDRLSRQFSGQLGSADHIRWKDVDTAAMTKALMALDDAHWDSIEPIAANWMSARCGGFRDNRNDPLALEPILPPLLQRMLHSANFEAASESAYVLSRTRDLGFLAELLSATPNAGTSYAFNNAVPRLIASDRKGAAKILEAQIDSAMAHSDPSLDRLTDRIAQVEPTDAIALVTKYTAQTHDEGQRQKMFGLMCSLLQTPESTAFLLKHYTELDSASREGAISRFGNELYEPAIPVLGDALKDKDLSVREAARGAFKKFREQREALDEYEAWMKADKAAKQTSDELIKLLASPNAAIVTSAVKTLGALKVRSAYPAIIKLLDRNDAAISAAVKEAIDKLAQ